MIKGIYFVLFLTFSSTVQAGYMIDSLYSDNEIVAENLTREVGAILSKKYNICFCGSGGRIKNKIETMAISFDCYKKLNEVTARELIVNCSEVFLNKINSNLKTSLFNYPFQPSNIEVRIFIQNANPGDLIVISALNGKLVFRKYNEDESYETVLEEPYQEALRIMREGKVLDGGLTEKEIKL